MLQNRDAKRYFLKKMLLAICTKYVIFIVTGIVVAAIPGILFGGTAFFKVMILITPLIGIVAVLETVVKYFRIYRRYQGLPDPMTTYLGQDTIEVTFDVMRSSDNTRQFRMTRADGPEHFHAEVIDPESFIVLESNVCGEIKAKFPRIYESRWVVVVNTPAADLVVKHYLGYPPELTNEPDSRTLLSLPKVLVIKQTAASDVFLFRFTETGEYAGDTWHQSIEEAKKQAYFEYGIAEYSWQQIPGEVKDVVRFALNL